MFRTGNQNRHSSDSDTRLLNFDHSQINSGAYVKGYNDADSGAMFEPVFYWDKETKQKYKKGFDDCRKS